MRALFLTVLLASVAAPAMAAPHDGERHSARHEDRSDHSDRNSNRPDRAERPDRARPQRAERAEPRNRQVDVRRVREVERAGPSRNVNRQAIAEQRNRTREAVSNQSARRDVAQTRRRVILNNQDYTRSRAIDPRFGQRVAPTRVVRRQQVQTAQRRDRGDNRWNDRNRDDRRWGDRDRNDHRWTDNDRNRWRGEWRNDRRYDWHSYRNQHRSIFRLAAYFDPFGYNNYRRFDIGFRLQPSYYSSRYWIDDPFMYRLPYAPPGYQWIRYYDDAILIDTWSGQVADVLYNFFW